MDANKEIVKMLRANAATRPLILSAPPQPWTYIEARTLLHVESSIDASEAGVPVCSVPKSKRDLAALLTELGSITAIEWQAIYDALAFTATHSGGVADAHNRAVDHVCRILGRSRKPGPEERITTPAPAAHLTPYEQRVLAALRDGADCARSVAERLYSDFKTERGMRAARRRAAESAILTLVRKGRVDVGLHDNGRIFFRPH